MPDPFFQTNKSKKRNEKNGELINKRKRQLNNNNKENSNKDKTKRDIENAMEVISDVESNEENDSEIEESEGEIETAEEKRLRLAKEYLSSIKTGLPEEELDVDAKEIDKDLIAERLNKDVLESESKLYYLLTEQIGEIENFEIQKKKASQQTITCVEIDALNNRVFTGSKDGSIILWDLQTLKKLYTFEGGRKGLKKFEGHTEPIYSLALSYDGSYLASGGKDKSIIIWDLKNLNYKGCFKQHKDAVTGLAFRRNSYDLYSCSFDRTVKVWSVEDMGYVETLFGHQDSITDIQCLLREQCITAGARDKTLRLWKIIDQTQLVFRGGISTKNTNLIKNENNQNLKEDNNELINQPSKILYVEGSLDKIAMLDEISFLSGGDSGVISLWDISKKKPSFSVHLAHGIIEENQQPYPITALATFPWTDLIISGSYDGWLRFWKINYGNKRSIQPIFKLPIEGFINSIKINTSSPKHHQLKKGEYIEPYYIIIGLGQEPAHGRWIRLNKVKNQVIVIKLPLKGIPNTI